MSDIRTSNFEKFQTKNPVMRKLFDRFFAAIERRVRDAAPRRVLDAGCGEGETLARLRHIMPGRVQGFDINHECVAFTRQRHPQWRFDVENIYQLPYHAGEFDLVLCLEVMEHLDRPEDALRELLRVTRRDVVLSVPHEPWFRLGNLVRGKYRGTWGNHPEHIQHWNRRTFRRLLAPHARIVSLDTSFPWIIAHCRKNDT